ncbi:Cdc6/Cdc18 family protein [Candidatus Hodarchaeum mangrovi]
MPSQEPTNFTTLFSSQLSVFKEDGENIFTGHYIPERIWHRETEMKTLASFFRSIITESTSSSRKVVIYGPVGTGKTAISRRFGRDLIKYMRREWKYGKPLFKYFHINCRKTKTPHLILTTLLRQLVPGFPLRGFGVDELVRMFNLLLYEQNLVVLVVLDEIDYLLPEERTDFLYSLSRLEEAPSGREDLGQSNEKIEARFNLLLITRDENFRHYLDLSTASSLGQNYIFFKPYTRAQLYDIIYSRAEEGLKEESYDNDLIDLIASLAEENGDARFAIDLLWRAAKIADQENENHIKNEHVRNAIVTILPIEKSLLDDLNTHQKILLLSTAKLLQNEKKLFATTPEVKQSYIEICEEAGVRPRRQTQVWSYLRDLNKLGLIQLEVMNRHNQGRSMGRVTSIRISDIPVTEIINRLTPLNFRIEESVI